MDNTNTIHTTLYTRVDNVLKECQQEWKESSIYDPTLTADIILEHFIKTKNEKEMIRLVNSDKKLAHEMVDACEYYFIHKSS
jgi:hypothetical protein